MARDLTSSLGAEDRYQRLLTAMGELIPFNAACLMKLSENSLIPLAGTGLKPAALTGSYSPENHPRLKIILESEKPVRFPSDSKLPDPFDGLVIGLGSLPVHACIGFPLRDDNELVGVLTADAIQAGTFDDLDPTLLETLSAMAGAALKTSSLIDSIEELAQHREDVVRNMTEDRVAHTADFIGSSRAHATIIQQIETVARTDLPVLITGETGVGKELAAQLVHRNSLRQNKPFIEVNCGALPEGLAESEFFGHTAGSFTGAGEARAGKFEVAHEGTLFLDEIGELPLHLQASLLRVLQTGEIQRVGSDSPHRVDVRIISATNRNLENEVQQGTFRSDLYHRLSGFPIKIAPLRNRKDDIPLLAHHFAEKARRKFSIDSLHITQGALDCMLEAKWPGNVRELQNVIQRAALMSLAQSGPEAVEITCQQLGTTSPPSTSAPLSTGLAVGGTLRERVDHFRKEQILLSIKEHPNNMAAAARSLGLQRSNFHQICRRHNIL